MNSSTERGRTHEFADEGVLEDLLDAARAEQRAPLLLVLEG